ncbi:MAG: hypothetical protein JWN70_2033 [Planctomycetaceae bacterium]|nr:hypothetical protein [Planctomycetaceae bacterium]
MIRKVMILALVLLASQGGAAPPLQDSVVAALGPKLYRDGDVVEILDVTATSPNFEQGDSVTVKGRARLQSQESANLCLLLTQTKGDGKEDTDRSQTVTISKGLQEFELKITIKHQGVLHLTYYQSSTGKPFGGTYFGTAKQMKEISKMDLSYYLNR